MISKMKTTSFNKLDDKQWEEVAVQSLKGSPLDNLVVKTLEGIDIKPLYTQENSVHGGKEEASRLHAIRKGIHQQDWTIAQPTYAKDSTEFMTQIEDALAKGNEAIVYDGNYPVTWQEADLQTLAHLIQVHPIYAFNVQKQDQFARVFDFVETDKKKEVEGVLIGDVDELDGFHLLRRVEANTVDLHEQGADIVTELAVALAIAVEEAAHYPSFNAFAHQFIVRFAIDTDFFMEMAKLRAFRALWQTLAKAYGHEKESRVPIYSETSLRTYSKLDPYVNLLRAGNEALSAALGGTDVLTVYPHNILKEVTPSANRYARNLQLVIKEETFVQYVLDPAGGSYYIDTLTNELIEKSWTLFREIENVGGYEAYVASGTLADKLAKVSNERMEQVYQGERSLIGTNVYANIEDVLEDTQDFTKVSGRLAQTYENFRLYFQQQQPNVVLLTFGALKDFKPRADFVKGYLAAAGIDTESSPAFASVEDGRCWMEENQFDYGVICMPPKETETMMAAFITDVPEDKWLDVAGKYEPTLAEEWEQAGIDGFIYKGQHQLHKFTSIKEKWEEEI